MPLSSRYVMFSVMKARHSAASLRVCALLGSLSLGLTGASSAQGRATTVSLPGIVRDTTGLVLPGATVELRRQAEPTPTRSTVSAADGTFLFPDVSVGTYRLRVSFPEFGAFDQTLTLDANSPRPLIVVLALSGRQEHVSVVGAGIDLPATATMQTDVSRRLIETLPTESVSAGLSSIVTLTTPGVAADSNGAVHPLR